MPSDYYAALGVSSIASQDEIKKQYKKLAIKFHPDKTKDKDHHQKFLLIREAYDTLKEEELRQKYNREKGIGLSLRPSTTFSRETTSGSDFPSHSRYQYLRTSYGDTPFGSSFYDFYQRSSRMYNDHFSRTSRREAARENDDKAAMYAEITRQKIREDQERRQAEYMRNARKQREEEELRKKMEESVRRQKQEKMAAQTAQEAFAKSQGFGDAKAEYEHAKSEAYCKARYDESQYHNSRHTSVPHEFIVVEDEEDESESDSQTDSEKGSYYDSEVTNSNVKQEFSTGFEPLTGGSPENLSNEGEEANEDNDDMADNSEAERTNEMESDGQEDQTGSAFGESVPPAEATGDYTNTSFPPGSEEETRPQSSSESSRTRSYSLAQQPQTSFDERLMGSYNGPKKPRLSNFADLKDSLNTFLDDVDFSDIRSTLPDYPPRTRKASSSTTSHPHKRARFAEYADGKSNAETLHTPVNKGFVRDSTATISVSDLSPKMDDSALIFSANIPSLTVSEDTKKTDWDEYVHQILEYQQKFANYRKAVMGYQMGRLNKDERHHNIIYSDTSCLDVYQSCLFNDVLLLQNFTRAMQEFRQTLRTFHINFEAVNKMRGKIR
ncbi:DnaJ-domain-containing protein [Metschnikowia bicuspidata var. bicuspidata NRRL YB-4993]|uniref:DnaJ-domain-containing protein n=1 Tax=Metschnikowia bicuspidata var. bicuspidata NRRL YB-4993 TaxID=869754 RepID=A0A1A0H734_9ASCO|nr:DnaJ-domain-containing protein [Metschnikowia bicuspidata var. bicuspidata NRRL YB-4993]OBA19846.1 DnaJ-domain-containing protein [Metschnikowia bicuspidata var. bicuspidata NRRL YB-4993]